MKNFLRDNALSLAMLTLFAICILGQAWVGHIVENEELVRHGQAPQSMGEYLISGSFIEAVFENWESEFLQMALFVWLTKFLKQKGSSESKRFDGTDEVDEDPRKHKHKKNVPWPVRRGGWVLALYERSLSLTLFTFFVVSFLLHAYGGAHRHNEEQVWQGGQTISMWGYFGTAKFWEESFQNWQSEFLSVAVLILLSIALRERYSPQSKPVFEANTETGTAG